MCRGIGRMGWLGWVWGLGGGIEMGGRGGGEGGVSGKRRGGLIRA
jgi:hypothetical protein